MGGLKQTLFGRSSKSNETSVPMEIAEKPANEAVEENVVEQENTSGAGTKFLKFFSIFEFFLF